MHRYSWCYILNGKKCGSKIDVLIYASYLHIACKTQMADRNTWIKQAWICSCIHSLWKIWVLHWTVILLWMHMSPILLGHATLNCVVWRLFVDSWQVLQLSHLYLLLFCQELNTVTHCCLVLLMMWHPTCNGYRTLQLEWSCAFQCHLV